MMNVSFFKVYLVYRDYILETVLEIDNIFFDRQRGFLLEGEDPPEKVGCRKKTYFLEFMYVDVARDYYYYYYCYYYYYYYHYYYYRRHRRCCCFCFNSSKNNTGKEPASKYHEDYILRLQLKIIVLPF